MVAAVAGVHFLVQRPVSPRKIAADKIRVHGFEFLLFHICPPPVFSHYTARDMKCKQLLSGHEKFIYPLVEVRGLFIGGMPQLIIHIHLTAKSFRYFPGSFRTHYFIFSPAYYKHGTSYILQHIESFTAQACLCKRRKTGYILRFLKKCQKRPQK